jgi:hypothetical protein
MKNEEQLSVINIIFKYWWTGLAIILVHKLLHIGDWLPGLIRHL